MSDLSKDLLKQLNPEQAKAVAVIDGPLLVFAGAGTGKTRVITYRIANMILHGVNPANIAGMTFTNKAAGEMRERLDKLVSRENSKQVFLGTFHSFCVRVLRKEIKLLGFGNNFTIADDSDQFGVIKQAIAEAGFEKTELSAEVCVAVISRAKGKLLTPQDMSRNAENEIESKVAQAYDRYMQILQNQNMLDFDDLLVFTVRLWQEYPDVLEKYNEKYTHILVDEYQDTNFLQFQLVKLLAGKKKNLCVVGDDDQSIYGWRGAEMKNILDFPSHFPKSKEIKLEQNYRCTNNILKAANFVIRKNMERCEKQLWSKCGDGEKIKIIKAESDEDEARYIAEAIHEITAANPGTQYNDFAVLYRSNHQSRLFENALRDSRIPYRLIGSRSFYERREIRDAIAYLKLASNPKDDQSFLRILGVPPRGIGDKAIEHLKKLQNICFLPLTELIGNEDFLAHAGAKAASGSKDLYSTLIKWRGNFSEPGNLSDKTLGYFKDLNFIEGIMKLYKDRDDAEKRRDNIYELINAIASFEKKSGVIPTLQEFLEIYALYDDSDKVEEEDKNSVTLMTVHAAKGLEFSFVFLPGMEHNIFPHERAVQEGNTEEERRLFYVALTRARKNVHLVYARIRMKYGKTAIQRPSSFLFELPDEISERLDSSTAFKPMGKDELKDAWAALYAIGNQTK
jgi:superfamily I DNA/RNA helicase